MIRQSFARIRMVSGILRMIVEKVVGEERIGMNGYYWHGKKWGLLPYFKLLHSRT